MPRRLAPSRLRFALLGVSLGLVPGCITDRPPSIEVTGATVSDVTDEAMQVLIDVELTNPNRDPLELQQFTYDFSVGGARMYAGRRAAEATLSSTGTKRMRLPAVIRFDAVKWSPAAPPPEIEWSIGGSLLYIAPGAIAEILLDTKIRRPTAGFRGRGRLALPAPEEEQETPAG